MDSREPREDHELADERAKWLLNLLLDRIHFYVTTDASASDVAEVIESLDEWDAFDSECAALVQIPKGFYTSDAQEAVDAALRRPSPVAESTPTDATAETYRCLACGSNNHEHRCTERKAPVEVEGACDLCAGECRGHSLGHEDQWTPEPGSRDALATELATLKQQLAESTPSSDTEGVRQGPRQLDYAGEKLPVGQPRDPQPDELLEEAAVIDGNDIWEALFGIMKGDVPDELNESVLDQLAAALSAAVSGEKAGGLWYRRWFKAQVLNNELTAEIASLRAYIADAPEALSSPPVSTVDEEGGGQ